MIRAVAFDNLITFSYDLPVIIADIPCTIPTVTIVDGVQYLGKLPESMRSLAVKFETVADFSCNKTVPVE